MSKESGEAAARVPHRMDLRVPLFEVDLGQAVYHGNYFHLFEMARDTFLRALEYPYRRLMEQNLHLTIVEVNCVYRKGLQYDDLIEVQTDIAWWRRRSMAFNQKILRKTHQNDMVLCTEAVLNMVCVNFEGRPALLPKDFVSCLEKWSETRKDC